MGGSGSGRWGCHTKALAVDHCLQLDANQWARRGIFERGPSAAGSWRWTYREAGSFVVHYRTDTHAPRRPFMHLWYSWVWAGTQQPEAVAYCVSLNTTTPHYGGRRWWFLCPLLREGQPCGRRVGKLYLPPRGRYFGCRHCHRLTYTSCQESHQLDGLYRKLAGVSGLGVGEIKSSLDR
jgi:hypothetical protein